MIAITRVPGPALNRCELTHLSRQPIDAVRAIAQHRSYQQALRDAGIRVIELPADPALPDGVFVEDIAIVLDELAVITSPTPLSRRTERAAVEAALAPFRELVRLPANEFLEGGDVLRIGRTLYVGQSARTSEAGLKALERIVTPFGYRVVPVEVMGCLHLKSACCALNDETVLINQAWIDAAPFAKLRMIDVPESEPFGANVLRLPNTLLVSASFPATTERIHNLGHRITTIDVSELHKAESGLTCMSLLFDELPFQDRPCKSG